MSRIYLNNIEGFVLAGGASRRMGRDKARLPFGEITLVERAATAIGLVTKHKISIVGNLLTSDLDKDLSDKFRFLSDIFKSNGENQRGAIVGLHAALTHSKTSWAAILACDLPFASGEIFLRLAALRSRSFDAIVPIQEDDRWQPLCALYRSATCLLQIEQMLRENVWSVKDLLQRVRTRRVELAELKDLPNAERFFLNVNTAGDYERALELSKIN